ncbi:uncharacterized protein LOC106053178 [Biomphalaria glabrata]|uniref:Uncharacterized protein LOC106053178 n=1 Tax=Biomphalaria glabrata TaxID=6526 RepID=A0A9W2YVZ8_BIOGL|nr:uncharacterized protein LOC106053178 [Biomphalaria glabrata]
MIIKNKTNRMEETTSVDGSLPQTGMECENTGVYICVVTDFNNNVNQRKLVKTSPGCPVKFCDATYRTILNAAVNTAVNFSLCLFYNDNIELVAVNTPTEYIQLVSKSYYKSENYLLLHFLIDNVHQSFPGNHTIEIITVNKRSEKRETLNRMITLVTQTTFELCNATSNNTQLMASLDQNITMEICIKGSSKYLKSVTINERIFNLSDTSVQSGKQVVIRTNSSETYFLQVTIFNIQQDTPTSYNVKLKSIYQDVMLFRFRINLEDSLNLCEKEKNFTSIKTQMYGTVTIHICYITNSGPLEYCGIDNELYRINDPEDKEDIYVSVEQFHIGSKYFMQIYFRNVTQTKVHSVLLKTSKSRSLRSAVNVSISAAEDYEFKSCVGHEIKTYYYAQLTMNMSICVLVSASGKHQARIQQLPYIHHGLANTSMQEISNVNISQNGTRVIFNVINVTEYNFGRYDLKFTICDNTTIEYTFYLIHDVLSLPSSLCNGGNTNIRIEASRDSLLTICFRTFGHLDRAITINNIRVPIVSNFRGHQNSLRSISNLTLDSKNILVYSSWNQQLVTRYIQIELVPTKSQEMKIEFDSINRILIYNISLNGTQPEGNEASENNRTNELSTYSHGNNQTAFHTDIHSASVLYAVPVVAVVVCTLVIFIVFIVRKKAKVKHKGVEALQLDLYKDVQTTDNDYVNVDNLNDVIYMNLKTSRPRSLRLVPNAPDLTKDLGERVYMNTGDLEHEITFNRLEDGNQNDQPSGRYISDEGLLYVTVSHANSLRSANSSASSRQTDNVIYASLDLEKSGKIPLLQFKRSRHKQKKKISDKKSMPKEDLL